MRLPIINCKQYAELVSEGMDRRLQISCRLAVKLHSWLCPPCESIARQFSILRSACRHLPPEVGQSEEVLPAHARERIKSILKGCIKDQVE